MSLVRIDIDHAYDLDYILADILNEVVIQEAGLAGFWVHRVLEREGMGKMGSRFSPEVRDRAVRMVSEPVRITARMEGDEFDCLKDWLHGRDAAPPVPHGGRPGTAPAGQGVDDKARLKLLKREVKELLGANETLRKASGYFAMAELNRRER